jgi:hypothetical protein
MPFTSMTHIQVRLRLAILLVLTVTASLCSMASPAHAASWPDVNVVGPGVTAPVTVNNTVGKDSSGELLHEGNRVPDIVALDPSNLVVGWRAGVADSQDSTPTDQGTIRYAYSSNGGGTWTTGTLAAADSTYRYHYVIFLNDAGTLYALLGRITISEDRESDGRVNGFPVTMVAKKSTDNGHTWSSFGVNFNVTSSVVIAGKPLKYNGTWLIPYWSGTRSGVLRSTDLANWTSGALAANPANVATSEPQVVVSQDDPGTLLMVTRTLSGGDTAAEKDAYYRSNAVYAATATSSDGGLTWSALKLDKAIPNYNAKGFFAKDANGQYLTIYTTFAGAFTGASSARPVQYREVLHYKVKRPDGAWGPGRLFADGVRETTGAARGWDVYASADEYSPGKFFVVWEHNQTSIKVSKLDVSAAFTGVDDDWNDLTGWTVSAGGGTTEIDPSSRLHLANAASTTSGVGQSHGPSGGFVATIQGRVTDYSTLDPTTGVGTSLAMKVSNGTKRLMLTIQSDGVYSFVQGVSGWSRVYTVAGDTTSHHLWKVVVGGDGKATLYRDGAETGASWVIATRTEAPRVEVWSSGSAADPADALVEHVDVSDNVAATTWDAADWTLDASGGGTAAITGGRLHLRNANGEVAKASTDLDVTKGCDFTVDFRGQVDDDSALDPSTGTGVSLGTKVANGARRLMLTIQSTGVWTIKKGATDWEKVYTLGTAMDRATWKVTVDSAGVAHLFRDGTDTGATWVVQDSRETPTAAHWVAGTAGGNAAEAHVEWTRVTCTGGAEQSGLLL